MHSIARWKLRHRNGCDGWSQAVVASRILDAHRPRRYHLDGVDGGIIALAAAAQKGRVYLLAAQCADGGNDAARTLDVAVESFRCKEEFKPVF